MFQERETVSVSLFFSIFLIPLPHISRLNHLLSLATLLCGTMCLLGRVRDRGLTKDSSVLGPYL